MLWLCAALAAVPGRADRVDLVDGDRLTGKVLRKDADQLILRTPYAGEIGIAGSHVSRVHTEAPMSLVLSDEALARARVIGDASLHARLPVTAAPPRREHC